nr:glycosyltransferase family A protein [Pantoea sp. 201603H]
MKITIVTATYNSERFIAKLYENLASQTYGNWEWIIVDDCSLDNSLGLLRELKRNDSRLTVLNNEKNMGAAVSRNRAIENASGDFIAFIDSDDLWESTKLDKQLKFMLSGNYEFSFTAYSVIKEDGVHAAVHVDLDNPKDSFTYEDMLCKKATLGCSTVMIKNHIISDMKMPLLRTGQDYAFWLKILRENKTAYLLKEPLTKYRIVTGSISRNKVKKAMRQWQIYRDVESIGFFKSCYCFMNYALRAILRG